MPAAAASHPELPQHVVTAVLVSHDGERWLPDVLAGLVNQQRPVQDVIAADTGSADRSADLVTDALGPERVLHLARRTGFGAAVAEAVRTAPVLTPDDLEYLKRPSGWDPETRTWRDDTYGMPELPHGEPIHWLWLLHDDSAPDTDALAKLLRHAEAHPDAAVIGPKLRGWYDRRQLLETGVTIARSGRRWTGLDRREQDQGQHDQHRSVLSVSTAGMLIRRDAYERLGGFDRNLPLMRDDLDLCWRAHSAGMDVRVAPSAVMRHAEASARERRTIDSAGRLGASPHRVDKAAAVYALLSNSRSKVLPWVMLRLVVGTAIRILAYLVGKAPGRALDEFAGLLSALLRPGRILTARSQRRTTTSADLDHAALRPLFPPPGATVKATVEQAVSAVSRRDEAAAAGSRHGAVESGPGSDDADVLEVEQFTRVRAVARRPAPVLFLLLCLVALAASRELIGGGALFGGALLAAPAEAGELLARFRESWQPLGIGDTGSAPPYLALLSLLSLPFLGSTGLAMTLLMVGAVPLAGLSAYLASKRLVTSRVLRAWGAIAYAFLPALTGAIASGRIGTVVLAILLPPLARCAVYSAGLVPGTRGPWRAAWAGALLLTVVTAFTPVIWPLAVLLAAAALARPGARGPRLRRFAALLLTPLLMLAPWSLTALTSADELLTEAGQRLAADPVGPAALLGLNPGGPGTPADWLMLGLLLAGLAALLRRERRTAVTAAWGAAIGALVVAVWANGSHWAGPGLVVGGLAVIAAAALGADGARHRVAAESFGWRQPVAVLLAVAAALGPALAAAGWMVRGADGPLERANPVQVPAFVAEESSTGDRARTLVLAGEDRTTDGAPAALDYAVVRGAGARLGDADIARLMAEDPDLSAMVADLAAGSGADQAERLGGYAIRYVLVRDGSPDELHRVLDTTPGLKRLSQEDGSALWRVERELSRVMVLPAEGDTTAPARLPAGPVEVDTDLPDGPEGRLLRIADTASDGWEATLDGRALTPVTVDGWAQGFELPAGEGRLLVSHSDGTLHTLWTWTQGFGLLVLVILALPGRRREVDDDLPDAADSGDAAPGESGTRVPRARRAAGAPTAPEAAPADPAAPQEQPVPVGAEAEWSGHAGDPNRPEPAPEQQAAPGTTWDGYDYAGQGQGGGADHGYGGHGYGYADPHQGYGPETGAHQQPAYPGTGYGDHTTGYPQQGYDYGNPYASDSGWQGRDETQGYDHSSDQPHHYGDGNGQR
ncbi:glycosyltransferase family 2 protein [Streptomyces bohaiensis]|uniref:Glycosyltransferase family 2 protein n=1 Tax=Streptomyces bohaiensis TaxID=1431344 RepID=A0ABX1CBW3_9ACTN|nr:glycosyltransferase family 2 protein [Streptomyces bohaiensis]NJQ16613.1 glycosyltransferase family 2 protein [Streptomyces bohaiensis]